MSTIDSSEKDQAVEELSSAISNLLVRADVLIKSNQQTLKDVFKSSRENDLASIAGNATKIYFSIGKNGAEDILVLYSKVVDARTKLKYLSINSDEELSILGAISKGVFVNLAQDNTILPLFKVTCLFGLSLKSIADPIMLKVFQGMELVRDINSLYNNDREKRDYDFLFGVVESICGKDIIDTPNLYDSNVRAITQGDDGGLSLKLLADFLSNPTSLYDIVPSGENSSDEL